MLVTKLAITSKLRASINNVSVHDELQVDTNRKAISKYYMIIIQINLHEN